MYQFIQLILLDQKYIYLQSILQKIPLILRKSLKLNDMGPLAEQAPSL